MLGESICSFPFTFFPPLLCAHLSFKKWTLIIWSLSYSSYMPQRPVREILWARAQSESIIFLFQTCAFSGGYFQTVRKELVCLLLIAYSLNSAHFPVFLFISCSQWVISPWPGIQHLISSGEKNNQSFNGANLFQIACSSVSPLKRVMDGIKPGPSGGGSSGAFKSVWE